MADNDSLKLHFDPSKVGLPISQGGIRLRVRPVAETLVMVQQLPHLKEQLDMLDVRCSYFPELFYQATEGIAHVRLAAFPTRFFNAYLFEAVGERRVFP